MPCIHSSDVYGTIFLQPNDFIVFLRFFWLAADHGIGVELTDAIVERGAPASKCRIPKTKTAMQKPHGRFYSQQKFCA
ncbi:hypothetical protein EII18_05930 [Comamonadaceae bacterium OH3737_COT-264]|nr:hypothetical protein EII18_05930 [Comamonadaceae bacterium OH3737_COT-264]